MLKVYVASAIDCSIDKGEYILKLVKQIFAKFPSLELLGAGIGDSPIISSDSSKELKGIITAYDLRQIRSSDILLVVIDLNTFCFGTAMEMEYSRQLGLYIIVCVLGKDKLRNIFIESLANKIVYDFEELENTLRELTK